MSPSPSWITENIYVWRPEGKTFVNVTVFFLGICIVFGTTFGSNGICNLSQKFGVKSGAKSNCLRENCGLSGTGNSVERFIPPVVGRNPKSFDCRCVIAQLTCFFFLGHLADQFGRFFSSLFSIHNVSPIVANSW